MTTFSFTLALHSWLRWLVLLLALVVIVRSLNGWFGHKDWTGSDKRWASWFAMIVSIQFVIGLVLLFMSPTIQAALDMGMGEVMKDSFYRKALIEHPFGMLVALALVHIGKSKAVKATTSLKSHKTSAIFYLIAVVLMLASIPWETSELFRSM